MKGWNIHVLNAPFKSPPFFGAQTHIACCAPLEINHLRCAGGAVLDVFTDGSILLYMDATGER